MNIFYLVLLLLLQLPLNIYGISMCHNKSIIKNINIPSCRNCIYYKPSIYGDEFSLIYSRCEKFGEKNIFTDEIKYDFVDHSRNDESKCGKLGKYFEEEKSIYMKFFNFISKNLYVIIIFSPFLLVIALELILHNNGLNNHL